MYGAPEMARVNPLKMYDWHRTAELLLRLLSAFWLWNDQQPLRLGKHKQSSTDAFSSTVWSLKRRLSIVSTTIRSAAVCLSATDAAGVSGARLTRVNGEALKHEYPMLVTCVYIITTTNQEKAKWTASHLAWHIVNPDRRQQRQHVPGSKSFFTLCHRPFCNTGC